MGPPSSKGGSTAAQRKKKAADAKALGKLGVNTLASKKRKNTSGQGGSKAGKQSRSDANSGPKVAAGTAVPAAASTKQTDEDSAKALLQQQMAWFDDDKDVSELLSQGQNQRAAEEAVQAAEAAARTGAPGSSCQNTSLGAGRTTPAVQNPRLSMMLSMHSSGSSFIASGPGGGRTTGLQFGSPPDPSRTPNGGSTVGGSIVSGSAVFQKSLEAAASNGTGNSRAPWPSPSPSLRVQTVPGSR